MKSGLPRGTPLKHRFRKDKDGCWYWLGSTDSKGYATMRVKSVLWKKSKVVRVLRWLMAVNDAVNGVLYCDLFEPIREDGYGPPDKDMDHLCYNRHCVNPKHGQWLERYLNRNWNRRSR